jgi:hypothetical protein
VDAVKSVLCRVGRAQPVGYVQVEWAFSFINRGLKHNLPPCFNVKAQGGTLDLFSIWMVKFVLNTVKSNGGNP